MIRPGCTLHPVKSWTLFETSVVMLQWALDTIEDLNFNFHIQIQIQRDLIPHIFVAYFLILIGLVNCKVKIFTCRIRAISILLINRCKKNLNFAISWRNTATIGKSGSGRQLSDFGCKILQWILQWILGILQRILQWIWRIFSRSWSNENIGIVRVGNHGFWRG